MMSRLSSFALIVALILPQVFVSTSGSIRADSIAPNIISQATFADPPVGTNGCAHPTLMPSVYFGVYVPDWLDDLKNLRKFENQAQKKVSIVMFYQGWGLTDGTQNFQKSWMNNIRMHGSVPMVTWEPWLYTAGVNQPEYRLINIINGDFDEYIQKWADDSKNWKHPYFLRFAAEMNGNWFPWSEQVNGNQAGEYVQAWKHVHDIFTSRGVTNVTWVWSPNVEYNGSTPLEGLYPGDDYVDWLGMDGYNWGTVAKDTIWQTFSEVFGQTYTHITTLSTKPLMVAETASTENGGSKAAWITDAFSTQIPCNFKRIKAFIWFNENKETDWRIESSTAAQNAFASAIQSCFYATNQYKSLSQSPIPVSLALSRLVCPKSAALDGWVLESAENSNRGGSMNSAQASFQLGDDKADRQFRVILSFNTASLPDNAIIKKATLKIKRQGNIGTNPFITHQPLVVDIRTGAFHSRPALQLADFQAPANMSNAGKFLNAPGAGKWYSVNLFAKAFPLVNRTGTTQFRLRFQKDDDNDNVADYVKFFSGNASPATNRPMLIIEYRIP